MRHKKEKGFTLVELMIVISIILILASVLAPSVSSAIQLAYAAKVRARVEELNIGCTQYYNANQFYPGQNNLNRLVSYTSAPAGTLTGSQLLAEALFLDYADPYWDCAAGSTSHSTNKDNWRWKSLYAPLTHDGSPRGDLITYNTKTYCVSDRFKSNYLPILYFPPHTADASGNPVAGRGQFWAADNSSLLTSGLNFSMWTPPNASDINTGDSAQAAFQKFFWDKRYKPAGDEAYNSGQCLIIAAGRDRMYGTRNTIKNWSD